MLAARERQAEIARPAIVREFLNPYWDVDDLEQVLLESAQQLLAELPPGLLESSGSTVVQTGNYANGDAFPLGTLMVLGARMQVLNTDTSWIPAQRLGIREWSQVVQVPASITAKYAFINGVVAHNGNSLHLVLLVEPALSDFQQDKWILPPTGDEEAVMDRAHRWLNIEDFMQGGRI